MKSGRLAWDGVGHCAQRRRHRPGLAWCAQARSQAWPGASTAPPIVAPTGSTQTRLSGSGALRRPYRLDPTGWEAGMDVVHPRCCGLDVHKKTVVACVLTPGATSRPVKQVRTFGTMTDELLGLADWLDAQSVTHVAMEATGAYWKPPWNLLEDQFELLLVNARHVKAVPGRKTDVKDAEWLAELLRHGLLRPSFVPDRAQRELRELTRYRTALVQEHTAE